MRSPATVFVVDDDPPARKALTLSLVKRGFDVSAFASAEEFLEKYAGEPGCLVLDQRLSGISGLELQQALRDRRVRIPVIFVSGFGDIPTSVRAIKGGAIDFLEKPVRQELLIERIEEAMAADAKYRLMEDKHREIQARFDKLTKRERDVLRLLVAESADTTTKHIASQLGISPRTVETYRARIIEKMQAKSVSDLVLMAQICDS